uniref:Tubulin delta chain n=1 Tax=Chromera velia CCMP2878 TaxID=1169474 RepID=A0A0G4HD30_9ALVE|eukprot:Cvel_26241.t1-p1 / transcript=Cvel_26241.t1 / gene=Cvel_26241 / organism=Chromera_velia_CCMP2878 / gene_product=Tubulin delta chain, putative / transcript_product=Tubulin delta chain, putative / location=Cvel_scaffold3094:3118-10215(-) / protein_length=508 / sequence_SO=supercontig / SO=protein_coding / is_pseudo=false
MSIVTVQLGQCGNQLGASVLDALADEWGRAKSPLVRQAIRETFFQEVPGKSREKDQPFFQERERWKGGERDGQSELPSPEEDRERVARAVLIDMEPKVVRACLRKHTQGCTAVNSREREKRLRWRYNPRSSFCQQSGSANNWAHGFYKHGPAVEAQLLEKLKVQLEACERLDGILLVQSLAGGTGSGLGAFVTQLLRDSLPTTPIVNVCVWPFASGEVAVQSYNAALSVAAAYEDSDAVLLFENDRFGRLAQQTAETQGGTHIQQPVSRTTASFHSLNRKMAEHTLPMILPDGAASPVGFPGGPGPLRAAVRHLCSHPAYKMVTSRVVPQVRDGALSFSEESWSGLVRRLQGMYRRHSVVDLEHGDPVVEFAGGKEEGGACPSVWEGMRTGGNVGIAGSLYVRGDDWWEAPVETFGHQRNWSALALDPLQIHGSSHNFRGHRRSAALLSNCQSCLPPLQCTSRRAFEMLSVGAHLHLFEAHGLEQDEMWAALQAVDQIALSYQSLPFS